MKISGGFTMDHRGTRMGGVDCADISLDITKYSDGNNIDVWCRSIELKEGLHLSGKIINFHGFQNFTCSDSKIEAAHIHFPINSNPDLGNCQIIGPVYYIDFSGIENAQKIESLEKAKDDALDGLDSAGGWIKSFIWSYNREELLEKTVNGISKFLNVYPGEMSEKMDAIKNIENGSDAHLILSISSILRAINNLPETIKDISAISAEYLELGKKISMKCECDQEADYSTSGYLADPVEACKSFPILKNRDICQEFGKLHQELVGFAGAALPYCDFGHGMLCELETVSIDVDL